MFALLALYAAPALFALANLARDLARRAGLRLFPSSVGSPLPFGRGAGVRAANLSQKECATPRMNAGEDEIDIAADVLVREAQDVDAHALENCRSPSVVV